MRWLDDISDAMNMNLGKLWEMVSNREAWHAAVHGTPWRKKWPPTPVFLPGKSHGQRSLAGYHRVAKSRTCLSN